MITHRASAGEWPLGDPPDGPSGGSSFDARVTRRAVRRVVMAPEALAVPARVPAKIRVVVVDEHDLIRAGFRGLIASEPGLEVVAEATNGAEALDVVRRHGPDVVLMDVHLPGVGGIEWARRLRAFSRESRIVLVSSTCDADTLMEALRAGAHGFVLKDVERSELLGVIRRVMAGNHAIESTLATELLRPMADDAGRDNFPKPEPLTAREIEVLRLISNGSTNREIATRLICAVGTVKVHVEHIMAKLGAVDRTQAAVLALEMGIIAPDPHPDGETQRN